MSTIIQEIPQLVVTHLEDVAEKFGLKRNPETLERLKQSWLEKQHSFSKQTKELGMEEVETFDPLDKRAALLLTYSGSLLSLHPLKTGDRSMDYTSIGLRKDVPESLHLPKGNLAETAEKGQPLSFQDSPLKQTSPLFAIMTCPGELELEDQKNLLDQASTVIIDSFVQLNKDFLEE